MRELEAKHARAGGVRTGKAGNRVQPFIGGRITEYHEMRQAICSWRVPRMEKLRGEHQYCRFISAFVKTSPFALNEPYYGKQRISKAANSDPGQPGYNHRSDEMPDAIWRDGHRYQKAGVMLGDFYSQGVAQLNLFDDNAPRKNSEKLMEVLDHLIREGWQGYAVFCWAGDPDCLADEARNAITSIHHEI